MDLEGLIEREMPYRVDIQDCLRASVKSWCEAHFGGNAVFEVIEFKEGCQFAWDADAKWTIWWEDQRYRFFFRNTNDAVEFKLRWG